jgi:hypothetical protein
LTLHEPAGERIFGIDNAHAVRTSRVRQARSEQDHLHRRETVRPYRYRDATLLDDFMREVETILRKEGIE